MKTLDSNAKIEIEVRGREKRLRLTFSGGLYTRISPIPSCREMRGILSLEKTEASWLRFKKNYEMGT